MVANHKSDRRYLTALILFQAAMSFVLYWHRLVPGSHDAFQILQLQYYFLNHTAMYGEIPYWMPYMTQGTIADWWFLIQGNLVTLGLSAFPGILRQISFLAVYHFGFFFELLVLTIGFWFWLRRFVTHSAALFAGVLTLYSTSLWFLQPWYNLRFIAYLPLIFHCLHRWQESRRMTFLLATIALAIAQSLGSLPYFLPVTSFVVFLYFITLTHISAEGWKNLLKDSRKIFSTAIFGALWFIPYYIILNVNRDWLQNYNMGRSDSGSVTFTEFLG